MKKLVATAVVCAATLALVPAQANDMAARAAAVIKAMPSADTIVNVPCASNFISNKMILASLKAGTDSQAVTEIVTLLQRPAPSNLAVMGENDGITLATLDRAFDKLKGKAVTPQEVAYLGHDAADAALVAKAADSGIKLIVVAYP